MLACGFAAPADADADAAAAHAVCCCLSFLVFVAAYLSLLSPPTDRQGGRHGPLRVTRLYERAFGHRLKDLEVLWIGFKEFVDGIPWDKLRPSPPPPSATPTAAGEGEVRYCCRSWGSRGTVTLGAAAGMDCVWPWIGNSK